MIHEGELKVEALEPTFCPWNMTVNHFVVQQDHLLSAVRKCAVSKFRGSTLLRFDFFLRAWPTALVSEAWILQVSLSCSKFSWTRAGVCKSLPVARRSSARAYYHIAFSNYTTGTDCAVVVQLVQGRTEPCSGVSDLFI